MYCAGRWEKLFRPVPITGTLAWGKAWVHMNVNHDDDAVDCRRPEVWDALSLLGPIQGTASDQPDGKTR